MIKGYQNPLPFSLFPFYTLPNLDGDEVLSVSSFLFLQAASLLLFLSCLHFMAEASSLAFISRQISRYFHVYSIPLLFYALGALGDWLVERF